MIVVDTNIISYSYISGERSQQAEQLLSADHHWNAPILWRSEFRSVLSQYLRNNHLAFDDVLVILKQAEELLTDNEFEVSSAHIMRLVDSSNCSSYDCEFVALAQHLNVPLVTEDKKILREFPCLAKSLNSYFD
ncbi:MAG: type II toxin-antitoxin system VapC family toxin [Sedimenticola sp.]